MGFMVKSHKEQKCRQAIPLPQNFFAKFTSLHHPIPQCGSTYVFSPISIFTHIQVIDTKFSIPAAQYNLKYSMRS